MLMLMQMLMLFRSFLAIFPSFVCRSLKSAVPLFRCKDCALAHLVRQFFGFVVYSVAQGFCVFYVSPVVQGWQMCFFMLVRWFKVGKLEGWLEGWLMVGKLEGWLEG